MKKLFLILLFSINSAYSLNKWECVDRVMTCHTWRMSVPQGWVVSGDNGIDAEYSMTFVPDINHEWRI